MRGFPDSKCRDCGVTNGVHLADCAGRVRCLECGGQYHFHNVNCSRLWQLKEPEPKPLEVGTHVMVSDVTNVFYGWIGIVERTIEPAPVEGTPEVYQRWLKQFYCCTVWPAGGYRCRIPLTFRRNQLKEVE